MNKLKFSHYYLLLIYLLIWGFSYYIMVLNLPKQFQLLSLNNLWNLHKNFIGTIKDHRIWSTPFGVSFSVFFEIVINSTLLLIGVSAYNVNKGFKKIIIIVIYSHCIFFIQIICEYIFIKHHPEYFNNFPREQFSLFSISYFLRFYSISFEPSLYYLFQTISFFEIAYWFLLSYFLSKLIEKSFGFSFKIIASSYLLVLIIWLLAITLISIINSL